MAEKANKKEVGPLLSRWVMLLAHKLQEDENWGARRALRQAHMTRQLLDALGRGTARFTYRKDDGEYRIAAGTLKSGVSAAFDSYRLKTKQVKEGNENTDGIYTYWDLDRIGFRSFKAKNLVSIDETFEL